MTVPRLEDITIVSDDEAEQADFVVCARLGNPTPFDNNLTGPCSVCQHPVMWRPHAPKTPKRVCMECATDLFSDDDTHSITTKVQQEAIREIRKKQEH